MQWRISTSSAVVGQTFSTLALASSHFFICISTLFVNLRTAVGLVKPWNCGWSIITHLPAVPHDSLANLRSFVSAAWATSPAARDEGQTPGVAAPRWQEY